MGILVEIARVAASEVLSIASRRLERAARWLIGDPPELPDFEYIEAQDERPGGPTREAIDMLARAPVNEEPAEPTPLAGSLEARGLRRAR